MPGRRWLASSERAWAPPSRLGAHGAAVWPPSCADRRWAGRVGARRTAGPPPRVCNGGRGRPRLDHFSRTHEARIQTHKLNGSGDDGDHACGGRELARRAVAVARPREARRGPLRRCARRGRVLVVVEPFHDAETARPGVRDRRDGAAGVAGPLWHSSRWLQLEVQLF